MLHLGIVHSSIAVLLMKCQEILNGIRKQVAGNPSFITAII